MSAILNSKTPNKIKFKVKYLFIMPRRSPNFSKMSETYIPKLMELNSYWQNAVEEAIQDTLKGEKRLYYALKNRKKIKQKLEKLGLKFKTPRTKIRDGRPDSSHGELHTMGLAYYPNQSFTSVAEDFSQVVLDPEKSRSRSRTRGETPQKYNYPERPLLGDGSLEKMKKSQNDFNYEAMGAYEGAKMVGSVSDFEKEEEEMSENGVRIPEFDGEMSNKKIEWIHMREKSNFEESDSEMSQISKTMVLKNDFNKVMGCNRGNVREKNQKIPVNFDPRGDLFWENEVKNAIRAKANFERKLQLALAKREILHENLGIQRLESDNHIEIKESEAKVTEKKRRGKNFLSPFVRFYLEVYRELCLKCPMKEIGEEAAKRWWKMSTKQRSEYSATKSRK